MWNMRGMSFVYLLCLLAYGRAFLWHIHLTSMACLWPVYGVPLQYLQIVYLWHVCRVCLWHIYGDFLKFSKAQENSKNMLKTSKKHRKTRALTTSHSLFKRLHGELLLEGTDTQIAIPLSKIEIIGFHHWFCTGVWHHWFCNVLHMPVSRWDGCIFFTWDEASKAPSYPYVSLNYTKQLWNLSGSFGFFLVISQKQICALRVAICIKGR